MDHNIGDSAREKFEEVFAAELEQMNQSVKETVSFSIAFLLIGVVMIIGADYLLQMYSYLMRWLGLSLSVFVMFFLARAVHRKEKMFENWKSGKIPGKLPYR